MKQLSIPQITDEELMRRYLKIKPIAEVGDGKYWLKDYSIDEMRNTSYFWSLFPDKREPVGEELYYHDYHEFECLHSFGFHGFFKPSIAEVLAQIPEDCLNHFTCFCGKTVYSPWTLNYVNWSPQKKRDLNFKSLFSLLFLFTIFKLAIIQFLIKSAFVK